MAHNTTPLSYRIPTHAYEKIEKNANLKGMKVGSWLRTSVPFFVNYPFLFNVDFSALSVLNELVKNRNVLVRFEGLTLSKEELLLEGFNFELYTSSKMIDNTVTISVLDYLIEVKRNKFIIKKGDDGSIRSIGGDEEY